MAYFQLEIWRQIILFLIAITTIFFRAIPEFIIAMIRIIVVGFGAIPGVLTRFTHGVLKPYAEDIEHVNKGPAYALSLSGASKTKQHHFMVTPQIPRL